MGIVSSSSVILTAIYLQVTLQVNDCKCKIRNPHRIGASQYEWQKLVYLSSSIDILAGVSRAAHNLVYTATCLLHTYDIGFNGFIKC